MLGRRWSNTTPLGGRQIRWLLVAGLLGSTAARVDIRGDETRTSGQERPVSFNHEIRPLLADRCFACHGPDERARKAKLRLDTRESIHGTNRVGAPVRGAVVVPGRPEESELFRRIMTVDEDDRMPPASSHLELSEAERELVRRWIVQGAVYEEHWSFQPLRPVPVPVPPGGAAAWGRNEIDRFVLARLVSEGLSPAPEASKERLIRRVYLDLTGLPPSPGEVEAYLADDSAGAYEKRVDQALGSPAYGEARAGEWLDLARYADTYGYQSDVERDMSPWRDWVIRAFNEDLPYDQFLIWQLAGDLLPGATRDQVLATAFNRLHRQTNEGGSIEEEFRTEYAADRVHTMGTAMLGLTLECARCHDHKYDPISQSDYYRMFAFFNNVDESGLYSHFTRATPTPSLLLASGETEAELTNIRQEIAAQELRVAAARDQARAQFDAGRAAAARELGGPSPSVVFGFDEVREGKSPGIGVAPGEAVWVDDPVPVEGRRGGAVQFSGDNSVVLKGVGAFDRAQPFTISLWLKPAERQERAVVLHRSRAWTDSGSRGYELVLEQMRPAFGLIHFWPGNAIQVRARDELPLGRWTHLAVTYDGSSRADGLRLYRDGEPIVVEVVRDRLSKDIVHRSAWGDADVGSIELTLGGRFRDSGFKGGAVDEVAVFDRCLTALEVGLWSGARTVTGASEADLFDLAVVRADVPYRVELARLRDLRAHENVLVNDVPEIMVMREMPGRRPTRVLRRGAYDAPGDAVEPGTPERIFAFPPDLPPNRLGLARWVTDSRNPLTARVAVNRAWRTHFGRGLVGTPEDVGSQGEWPTHPELLDWLAGWFVRSGWDVKALHRLIVTSATYRQTSAADAALVARDPENRLLARGPKHRLRAEQIRDAALAVSGLLSDRLGGPSVKPYQPAGVWEESGTGKTYVQDHGEALVRRSLYTFWRRTAPPPSMLAFDAPTREVCTARRPVTTTPLQALVLLNDPQFVEAGRVLAEHLVRDCPGDSRERVGRAFRLVTGRTAEARELEALQRLYGALADRYNCELDAADRLLRVGEQPVDPLLPPAEVAALSVVAGTLFNLDEFVMKR